MATCSTITLILLICGLFISNVCLDEGVSKTERKKRGRVTVTIVNRRLVTAEKTLKKISQELTETKLQLHQLQEKVASLSNGGSNNGGGQGVEAENEVRFNDMPPCPGIDGFFYSEQMKSCYHLEPLSVLVNFTEASATCSQLHPKAHIVAINNPTEQDFLKDKWFHERGIASISRFWINLGKVENRDQWKWQHDQRRLLFSHWIPTTSHNDERFQCAAVYSNEAYYWGDVACWGPHLVTCEVDM